MSTQDFIRTVLALIFAISLAYRGWKRKSLSISGSIAAFIVGFIAFATSYCHGTILIMFYLTGSRVTRIKENVKATLEVNYQHGGQRNYIQVLTNSILATIVAILHMFLINDSTDNEQYSFCAYPIDFSVNNKKHMNSLFWCLYIAHYACANGDTWASELGILARSKPRLITSFFLRAVPPGTNGGMSLEGIIVLCHA